MSNEILDKIKYIFEVYLRDPEDYDELGWKGLLLDLHYISVENPEIFTDDARDGFRYLGEVVYHNICRKCGDDKAFDWLKEFAEAWINNFELPSFPKSCWYNEDQSKIINVILK